MLGTVNQIAWAVQIQAQVDAEFDRVRKVPESVATKQSPNDGTDLQAIIRILEDKRAEVMGNEQAGYFNQDWQALRDQGPDVDRSQSAADFPGGVLQNEPIA